MPLSFKDLLQLDIERCLDPDKEAEWVLLKPECGSRQRIAAVTKLDARIDVRGDDEYTVEMLTIRVSVADLPEIPEIGTAARREVDPDDRWFAFVGLGEGEAHGMWILDFVREVPRVFGGNPIR